ncbi:unnamed protein product [Ophioblennius macclurei]
MAHVHYKFSSQLSYDTLVFHGPHTTLRELKKEIMSKEKLRATNCDLHVTNAQTKEEYTVEEDVIPKGSSVIVRRIPTVGAKPGLRNKANHIERSDLQLPRTSGAGRSMDDQNANSTLAIFSKMANLADADVPEEDKLKVLMSQSFCDSMNLTKKSSTLPESYTCYRCGLSGHHIRSCPTIGQNTSTETPVKIKKSTGIPRSFMVEVDDPSIKGAMLTNRGRYAIPVIDAEAYAIGKKEKPLSFVQESESEEDPIPDELLCMICRDLLCDSVVIPCCGNSYCDDCIRTALLDSEDHVCPTCSQSDVSPDTLIANKFLRQAVNNFKKERGYANRKKPAASQSQNLNPTPKAVGAPPPLSRHGLQQKPQHSHVRQQDSLQVYPEAAKTPPPLSQVTVGPPTVATAAPVSAHATPSVTSQAALDGQGMSAAKDGSPPSHDSSKDPSAAPSRLTPPINPSSMTEQPQTVSVDQETPSGFSGHSQPPAGLDSSSSSAGCWSESVKQQQQQQQQPAPPVFHTNLPAHQPNSCYPPGYPPATPLWTPAILQGSPIASLGSHNPPVNKEWYRPQREDRASRSRCSSSHSKAKSSQSYSHSSSRSESRSRSRSKDRSRHRSSSSRRRDHHSRSRPSCSYTFGYKRSHSPTPSSSSSPRADHQSKSRRDHRRSRHDSKSSSSRRGDRSRRDPSGAIASQRSPSGSLELDRERYMQWKKEYTEWCEKYLSSYVSHFHQLPFAPLLGPPPACPQWEGKGEATNRPQTTGSSRAAGRESRSPSSDSSSCSRSSPSHSSSESRSTPSRSPSRSSHSHKDGDCRSPPSQSSSDGLPSEGRNRTRTRDGEDASHDQLPTPKDAEKETKTQEVENRERSSSPESQNKSIKTETPAGGRQVSNTSDAVESIQRHLAPDKREDERRERKTGEEKNLEREKTRRTDKDSHSGRVEDGRHKVKSRKEPNVMSTDGKESRGHDSRSSRNTSKKRTDFERKDRERSPAAKHQREKSHKSETEKNPKSRKSESPKPPERKKPKKESRLLWTKADVWEKGIEVKPQKKINININLDVRRKDESVFQQDLSNLENVTEKTQENTEHVLSIEEMFDKENGKTETSREEETEEATKPVEVAGIWDQNLFTKAGNETSKEAAVKDGNEDLNLWQCAFKSAEETDDVAKVETVNVSHQDQEMEELTSSSQREEENLQEKNGGEEMVQETNVWGEEDANITTLQTSKDEIHHEQLTTAENNVNPAVDECGTEESDERRHLAEKSQDRAADGQDEEDFVQVICSKWELGEKEEEEVGVHADSRPATLGQPPLTASVRPTEKGDGRQRQRSTETESEQDGVTATGKDREAQRHDGPSASSKRVASPSGGEDQTSSRSYPERERKRSRERATEEERKEHRREKDKVRSRDKEVDRSGTRKHSSSSHDRERVPGHRSSSSSSSSAATSRHSSTGRRSTDLPDHNSKKSSRDGSPASKSTHHDPSKAYRHQARSGEANPSRNPSVPYRHSRDSAESPDRGRTQSKGQSEGRREKREREPNKSEKTKTDGKSGRGHRDVSEQERARKREEEEGAFINGTEKNQVGKR